MNDQFTSQLVVSPSDMPDQQAHSLASIQRICLAARNIQSVCNSASARPGLIRVSGQRPDLGLSNTSVDLPDHIIKRLDPRQKEWITRHIYATLLSLASRLHSELDEVLGQTLSIPGQTDREVEEKICQLFENQWRRWRNSVFQQAIASIQLHGSGAEDQATSKHGAFTTVSGSKRRDAHTRQLF